MTDAHSWGLGAGGVGFSLMETGKGLRFQFGLGPAPSLFIFLTVCNQEAEEIPYECLRDFPDKFCIPYKTK